MIPYTIKSFRGGISDESDKGVQGAFKHGYGLDIHSRDDSLKCASSFATIDESVITDLIQFFVPASDGSTYAFGYNGSIYAISGEKYDPAVSFVYNDENGKIRGASEWKDSAGNNYLVWATRTSVARRLLNGSVAVPWGAGEATQDYKTTLEDAEWHTMGYGSGVLNILNFNQLATIDYPGNFNASALNVRPGNILKCLEERDDYVILGSERIDESEQGHLWSWITVAANWVQKKRVPVKGVNAMIFAEFPILQGGDEGELFLADLQSPTPLHGVPGGGRANPGGVSIENDIAVFGIYGGTYPGIWSYGRKRKNRPFALNYQYRLAKTVNGSTVSTIGAVAVINGLVVASWGTTDGSTSDYGVDMVSSTTRASALYEGLEFDGGAPHIKKSFDTIHIIMKPLPTGTSVAAKFKQTYESSWQYAFTGSNTTSFSGTGETEAIFSIGKPSSIYEVGAELTPSGSETPEITSITTYLGEGAQEYG